ncbi:hypothetical protein WOLCODRAFT_136489 [Wolfiporia cocos MD-104 SS10]|uniref:Transmembrane protein n=1 Tax=Wolfiporia cocos (strain MD-104) TaxID=742152 RepID=A0A2H3JLU0_WOLCO|nr:hypothetical protein WOLCODRAFT_136489 [Wolfiporia cocos MD-104 SS10]
MAQPVYRSPPIAGRPPYATDEPDSVYEQQSSPTRRVRQPAPPNPNDRSSAYNMYDQYLEGGNATDNPFDDSKQAPRQQPIPLAAPKPGYAAPVAALNLARPSRAATPEGRQPTSSAPLSPEMSQAFPKPLTLVSRQASPVSGNFPQGPHQLQASMTPIAPAFIRPSSAASGTRDVKFSPTQPILRGEKEEPLPKRGQGEDFWRRFSMVAKEDSGAPGKNKQSAWLHKTTIGSSRHARWVWLVGMTLLLIIVLACAFGVYKSHKDSNSSAADTPVTALGGSADEGFSSSAGSDGTSTYLHVSPTNTVARRDALYGMAMPSAIPVSGPALSDASTGPHLVRTFSSLNRRQRRSPVNRTE